MAIVVRHATQSAVQDEQVPGEIGPDEWNENHTVTGVVAAPASSTDNAIARFDGTDGQIQNSSQVSINDTGKLTINQNSGSLPAHTGNERLHIGGPDSGNVELLLDAFANNPTFSGRRANGTNASKSATAVNNTIGQFQGFGYGSTAYSSGARVRVALRAAETWTDTAHGTHITFEVTPIGSTTAGEVARIANDGSFQLGGTNTVITSSRHPQLRSYTVATLPSAATTGQFIYVSDEIAGAVPCFSDGTNWRRVTDRAIAA